MLSDPVLFYVLPKGERNMTTLTATNERVQAYMYNKQRPNKGLKNNRLQKFNDLLHQAGKFITELFPRKQVKVLDEILYITSGCGIAKIGLDKLAVRADVSERTAATAVKKLKETGQYIIARLNAGQAGKYIFVDKQHPNFLDIMEYVFHKDAIQLASHFATLQNAETVDTTDSNEQKEESNCFTSSISSFETSFISDVNDIATLDKEAVQEIRNEIDSEPAVTIEEQKVLLEQYATNEHQKMYFEIMTMFPLHEEIKSSLWKLALRVGSDATVRHMHIAKTVTFELNMQLHERTTVIKESVVALFSDLYTKELAAPSKVETKAVASSRPVEFYDWLSERESVFDGPNYNWLDER